MPAYNSLRLQSFIINDIIDFSNYYANSLFLQTKDFSFTELINEISELFRFQFKHKNMGFKFVMVKNELTSFNTDYCRLLQVIVNLL
jgi:signal transduction histidine kinase